MQPFDRRAFIHLRQSDSQTRLFRGGLFQYHVDIKTRGQNFSMHINRRHLYEQRRINFAMFFFEQIDRASANSSEVGWLAVSDEADGYGFNDHAGSMLAKSKESSAAVTRAAFSWTLNHRLSRRWRQRS